MFNKFNKLRSGSRAQPQPEGVEHNGGNWSPMIPSSVKRIVRKTMLRGEDLGPITDSEVIFAERLFPAPIPTRRLQRSSNAIDTTQLSVEPDGQGKLSPMSSDVNASKKSVELNKEQLQNTAKKSWADEVANAYHSNGDSRRKSGEPVLRYRPQNGDSNRTVVSTESTFSKRDNSSRSWTTESISDDEEHIDRSTSSVFYESEGDDDSEESAEYADAEEKFLQANTDYFETLSLENVRRDQYPKLSLHRHVYMDYASLALSSRFQMEEHMKIVMAQGHMFAGKSSPSADYAAMAQVRLLQMFNTDSTEYTVVFTTGLKASFRLVANAYPFQKGGPILVSQDNHDAVNQLISASVQAGGRPVLAPLEESDLSLSRTTLRPLMKRHIFQSAGSLFVYPAQSSITGIRHSMQLVNRAQNSGWHVLLDASTLLPTGTINLSQTQPDFVLGSFQNIVGYPSGMGFLLVRRSSFLVGHVPNSNAITLTARASPSKGQNFHIVAEDESLSKLSFAGLDFGLQHLQSIGLEVIRTRVRALANWMVQKLKGLRHIDPDDWSLLNVYSPYMTEDRGNIISFNVLDSTGEVIVPSLVQRLAARNQITLAVGSFSNPGVANLLGPAKDRLRNTSVFERAPEFECVQVSLGPLSNFEDAYRVVHFLSRFRNQDYVSMEALGFMEETSVASSHFERVK